MFVVEGDSAGGSAVSARDRNTQAILPLRGKILNVEKSRIDKVLGKHRDPGADHRDRHRRARRVRHRARPATTRSMLLTDADVDGAHIRTLALTLLFREMQPLIEAGYVYIAKPPLYRLTRGQKHRYIERESELEEILLGDKFEKIEVFDRYNKPFKLTEARWQRFARLLKQYEGWASALRAAHGHGVVELHAAGAAARGADHRRRRAASAPAAKDGHATATPTDRAARPRTRREIVIRDDREPRRAWRPPITSAAPPSTRTSTAGWPTCTRSWRSSPARRRSTITLGDDASDAATFEELREERPRGRAEGGRRTTASRASARWTPRSCARRRWTRPPARSCR